MKRISLLLTVLGLACLPAWSLRADGESTPGPVPVITFEEIVHDAGESWEGDAVSHVFTFTNTGNAVLEITRVRSGCGCTASNLSSDRIAPGQSGEIRVSFNTRGYRGRKSQYVYVTSNAPASPTLRLTLATTVKTLAAFSPRHLQFGRVMEGRAEVREISLVFDGEPAAVREISVEPNLFSARILESGEAGRIPIEVSISPEAPPGQHRGTLTARLDHPRFPSLTARLHAVVEEAVQFSPRTLSFNRAEQESGTVKEIRIVNKGEKPIAIQGAASQIPEFEVVEIKTVIPGKEFTVTVRLRPPAEPGNYSGNIRIATDRPGEELIEVPLRSDS